MGRKIMRKQYFILIAILIFAFANLSVRNVYADIYSIPLNVNGSYQTNNAMNFDIDLDIQFSQINDVRFQVLGDITAVDAPGLFECIFVAAPGKWQRSASMVVVPSSPPAMVPLAIDTTFISINSATWDFLLDGTGEGYVRLITSIMSIPESPPPNITGNISSANLLIDATPVSEPITIFLLAGGVILSRLKRSKPM